MRRAVAARLGLGLFMTAILVAACSSGGDKTGASGSASAPVDNLLTNASFEDWPDADATQLPPYWRLVEWETTVARETAAERVHDGKNALRMVAQDRVVSVANSLSVDASVNADLRGALVTAGVWVRADTPGAGFISIRDGVGESAIVDHPGDGSWHFVTVTHRLDPAASTASLRVGNKGQDGKSVVVFDGAVLVRGASLTTPAG